jgi:hypothetical protein
MFSIFIVLEKSPREKSTDSQKNRAKLKTRKGVIVAMAKISRVWGISRA